MATVNWIKTYIFLGYPPSEELETEIFNKAKEVGVPYKKSNPINPNNPPYLKKISEYPQPFLQQYFQDKVGNP
jgi:hypothetical protein